MMKLNGNQRGFSLIELMVVVGIIGILAAIAVPNFQKFQAKSRQTEAKSQLGALYTAEKAFYAEWNQFFGDFRDIGYAPEGGSLRYRIGFTAAGASIPANSGYSGPSNTNPTLVTNATQFATNLYCVMGAGVASYCREHATNPSAVPGTATVAAQTFTAGASGNIDADPTQDQWTITHQKILANVSADVAD